jgi:hypothetical protein
MALPPSAWDAIMFDTLLFIGFCAAVVLVAFAAIRVERDAGMGRKRGGWKPTPGRRDDSGDGTGA